LIIIIINYRKAAIKNLKEWSDFMRFFYISMILFLVAGCAGKTAVKETEVNGKPVKSSEAIKSETGWTDRDTYTVTVTALTLDKAKEAARHKILQDIVRVRMLNESRFTDITKISAEFDKPLKEGKVLTQKQTPSGIEIYYQIKDTDLREKFDRK